MIQAEGSPALLDASRHVAFDDGGVARQLFGSSNANLAILARVASVAISARGTEVTVGGESSQVDLVIDLLRELYDLARSGRPLYGPDFDQAYRLKASDRTLAIRDVFMDTVYVSNRRRVITPQGLGQKRYIDAIRKSDVVFGIGPAGTGKTYLAVAMAVAALKKQQVERLIITRPAVEAGERLGFLPGDLAEKVNPYLRPLYDALHDMMDPEQVNRLMERGTIEVAPLAFMRGRTLNDAFIILDEAQNTTSDQMKMFLTRLGFESKAVITGDVTQVDLPGDRISGLIQARTILAQVPGISFCRFDENDVVRHPLVREVILAYERFSQRGSERPPGDGHV